MGLDINSKNHRFGCPYSTFNQFRTALGDVIGIKLMEYEGFKGTRPFSEITDDLYPLLTHSDCDGDMSVPDSGKVAKRLTVLLPKIKEASHPYFLELTERLIAVLADNHKNRHITKFA